MNKQLSAALLAAALIGAAPAQPVADIDVALVLVVDTSGSVQDDEYRLQRDGIAAALTDPSVVSAIAGGAFGRIALAMVDFSSQAEVRIGWTLVAGKSDVAAFASAVLATERRPGGMTSVSAGLAKANELMATLPYRATKRVIDVSGDGLENATSGVTVESETAAAKAAGTTINGLAIVNEEPGVLEFYQQQVMTGEGAFVLKAEDSYAFGLAMRRKLVREIS